MLRFDEQQDVILSVDLLLFALNQQNFEAFEAKWAVVALHSALHGALVCLLSGTTKIGSLEEQHAEKMLDFLRTEPPQTTVSREAPKTHIAPFNTLIDRATDPAKRLETGGGILDLEKGDRTAIQKLHDLRCNFMHFSPMYDCITRRKLFSILEPSARTLLQIAADDWAFRRIDHLCLRQKIEKAVTRLGGLSDQG